MNKTLPYRARLQDSRLDTTAPFSHLCLNPTPPDDEAAVPLFPQPVQVDAALLPRLRLILTVEAHITGSTPVLRLMLGGITYAFDLTILDRLAAGYVWQGEDGLLPTFGGGIATGATAWQLTPGAYLSGTLPTGGLVTLTPTAFWSDIELQVLHIQGQFAE